MGCQKCIVITEEENDQKIENEEEKTEEIKEE
jgi:hypothetical protein